MYNAQRTKYCQDIVICDCLVVVINGSVKFCLATNLFLLRHPTLIVKSSYWF